jgi:arginase family enzyme
MTSVAARQTRQGWHSVLVGGIATFMGAPLIDPDAASLRSAGAKAAFLGMPFDSTTIARPGAQLGPRAVRDWSSHTLSYHGEYDLDIFEALGVVDMGDVAVIPANAPKTVDLVAESMGEALGAGALPVLCGGEHITTIAGSLAVDRHAPAGTYGLILVDTHLDTAPDVGGETVNHCCPITRAMELDAFDPAKCVIIGPHGAMNPKSEYAYVREAGVTVFHVSDVDRLGARAVAEKAVAIASDGTAGVYFSFDVDSLDSSVCTGTCVPTMGGLTSREALTMVSVIGRADLVAMDVCEVAPAYDHGQSAMAACQVIVDTLAAFADAHRE